MIERGVAFLLGRQGVDGYWRDFLTLAGEGIDWPTGFVCGATRHGRAAQRHLEHAARALVDTQHRDGGWGYHAGVPTDADSTACALLFLTANDPADQHVERAAACLVRHQDPDSGGLPTYREPAPIRAFMRLDRSTDLSGWCRATPRGDGDRRCALAMAGEAFRDAAAAAWSYVRSRQRDGRQLAFLLVDLGALSNPPGCPPRANVRRRRSRDPRCRVGAARATR